MQKLEEHVAELLNCSLCPAMIGPVVSGRPNVSKVYLCGQAPGPHEGKFGKPFAWTAGKTLFRWFGSIGVDEETFRTKAYMAAVCRCYPGKGASGGDRVPDKVEISNCSRWMDAEFGYLQPQLVIPVGKLAINLFAPGMPLTDVVGKVLQIERNGTKCDVICLPHPSGASTWFKMEPGKTLLAQALQLLSDHEVWRNTFGDAKC